MAFDDDLSEVEQVERIRTWWGTNWAWLLSGIVLGIGMLVGWNYWNRTQALNAEQAGQLYRELVAASDRNDFGTMERLHGQLGGDHDATPYADQASLVLARLYVETGEYDKAVTLLRDVMDNANDEELGTISRLRLARVLIEQDKADEALALLSPDTAGAFAGFEQEIRGDALFAKGDMEGARAAYASALTADAGVVGADRQLLQLKLQDLQANATPAQAAPADASAPVEQATP